MSTFDAILLGALVMAALTIFGVAAFFVVKWLKAVATLLQQTTNMLSLLSGELLSIRPMLESIKGEMAYMRGMAIASGAPQPESLPDLPAGGSRPVVATPPKPSGPAQFPTAIMDRFEVAPPDAVAEDNDVALLGQTDAQLEEIERIEKLRQSGVEVEDDDVVHDGIVADSE